MIQLIFIAIEDCHAMSSTLIRSGLQSGSAQQNDPCSMQIQLVACCCDCTKEINGIDFDYNKKIYLDDALEKDVALFIRVCDSCCLMQCCNCTYTRR